MLYVLFDIEATCWEGEQRRILQQETIELGSILIDEGGSVIETFHRFIRPEINPYLSPYCKKLTGITQEQLERAPRFGTVIQEWKEVLTEIDEDFQLIAWGKDDRRILHSDCVYHRHETNWLEAYRDLKKAYQQLKGWNASVGFKTALMHEQIEFEGKQHSAINDVYNMSRLFLHHFGSWSL